jgi:cytochrome P450
MARASVILRLAAVGQHILANLAAPSYNVSLLRTREELVGAVAVPSIISIPNLVDPMTYADHDMAKVWHWLRSHDPVHRHPASKESPGFWVLSRHAEISHVLRNDTGFSSEKGNVLATMLAGGDTGAGRMLAVTDGHHHTELRRLLLQAFAPRALEGVVRRVRQVTRRLLTEAIERGHCDFAHDIASVIPLETICDLLDIPADDRQDVLKLTKSALSSDYAGQSANEDRVAQNGILVYFSDLLRERRRTPGADPISMMATAEVDGRGLDDSDIILNCYSLIMGGDETSRLAMIGAVKALIDNPGQWAALKGGDVTTEDAGEEVLRWTTPTMHFGRTATIETTLLGRRIVPGDLVTLWLVSANRDEAVFPEADKFDLARSPNRHLSLGYGRHFCLGAYLGRVEISTMLDALRTFVTKVEQAGPERHLYSNFLSGMTSLPITIQGDLAAVRRWEE